MATVLREHETYVASLIQGLWEEWVERTPRSTGSILLRLCEVAALLRLYVTPHNLDWFIKVVGALVDGDPDVSSECGSTLRLARQTELLTSQYDTIQQDVASDLALTGIRNARTFRDLDAYEDLPDSLQKGEVHALAARQAQKIIQDELESLEMDCRDADMLSEAVDGFILRAGWYAIEVDAAPILDLIDELRSQ